MGWRRRIAGWTVATVFFMYGLPGHVEDGKWWLDLWDRLVLTVDAQATWEWWNYVLVAAGVLLTSYTVLPESTLARVADVGRRTRISDFDIPILKAVNHLMQTEPHSYGQSGAAERLMFRLLHSEMCSGELRVIGRKGEAGAPRRISAAQCKRLTPHAAVIPRSPAAPNGIRYSLFDDQQVEYLGLRVRSRDLYRRWRKGEKSDA